MKSISKKVLGLLICSSVILSSLSIGAYGKLPAKSLLNTQRSFPSPST